MSAVLLTKNLQAAKGVRKSTLSQQVKIGSFALLFMTIVFICFVGFMFLRFFNDVSTKGYVLRRLENERMNLVKLNEIEDMKISQAKTLSTVYNSEVVKKMIKLNQEKITYIRSDSGLAVK